MTRRTTLILTSTIAISHFLTACCCGPLPEQPGKAPATVPKNVPVYPGATNVEREFAGTVTRQMEVPTTATEVREFYEQKLKADWTPVDGQWHTRTKLEGTRFQYRRYQSRKTPARIIIDVADRGEGKRPTGVQLRYCARSQFLCEPTDRISIYDRKRAEQTDGEVTRVVREDRPDHLGDR